MVLGGPSSVFLYRVGRHQHEMSPSNSVCLSVLGQDETEARCVHRTLCGLVEQQDPGLLGANLGQV